MKKILTSILLISIFAGATLPAVAINDQTQTNNATINQAAAQVMGGSTNIAGVAGINTQGDTQAIAQLAAINQSQCQGTISDILSTAGIMTNSICKP